MSIAGRYQLGSSKLPALIPINGAEGTPNNRAPQFVQNPRLMGAPLSLVTS